MEITTNIGQIFAHYDAEKDDFDMVRITGVKETDDKQYIITRRVDDKFRLSDTEYVFEKKEFMDDINKNWILLKSEGIISLSNVVALTDNNGNSVNDVLTIFFPNNKVSQVPDSDQPFVIARQSFDNIFEFNSSNAGVSVTLPSMPDGWCMTDFMVNEKVLNSFLCHFYKTDTEKDIATIFNNSESNDILLDMYDHALMYCKNTIPGYEEDDSGCISGYSNDLEKFFRNTGFIDDVRSIIGIFHIDSPLTDGALNEDDKLLLSTLSGGIRIDKAAAMRFGYDIDVNGVKMKYMLVMDSDNILWIVPYTASPDEISKEAVYNLTEERTTKLHDRLVKIVRAYDESIGVKSGPITDFVDIQNV